MSKLDEQIETMKKRILDGDFLCNIYLAQYSPMDCTNPFKQFCLYRVDLTNIDSEKWEKVTNIDASEVSKWVDNDVSLAAIVTYCLMYDWMGDGIILPQPNVETKYQVKIKGHTYRGDALTSAWTPFRRYLESLWLSEKSSKKYRERMDKYFDRSANKRLKTKLHSPKYQKVIESYYKNENYEDYIQYRGSLELKPFFFLAVLKFRELFEAIDQEISSEAKAFLGNYMMPGNYIAVPEYFNSGRSNGGEWDTVDCMLWRIYKYFASGKDEYLSQLFCKWETEDEKRRRAVENCKDWFADSGIHSWEEFVSDNLLTPFVDPVTKVPIVLKNPNIDLSERRTFEPIPKSLEEFEIFFETVNRGILKRNNLIWERCKKNADERQSGGNNK